MQPTSRVGRVPADAGQVIRAWRRRIALTQEGLAQALSVTFSTVSRWENGHVKPSKLAWKALEQFASSSAATTTPMIRATNPDTAAPPPLMKPRQDTDFGTIAPSCVINGAW